MELTSTLYLQTGVSFLLRWHASGLHGMIKGMGGGGGQTSDAELLYGAAGVR